MTTSGLEFVPEFACAMMPPQPSGQPEKIDEANQDWLLAQLYNWAVHRSQADPPLCSCRKHWPPAFLVLDASRLRCWVRPPREHAKPEVLESAVPDMDVPEVLAVVDQTTVGPEVGTLCVVISGPV